MEKAKTHFPQVPLTVVRTVVEEQVWLEAMMNRESKKADEEEAADAAEGVDTKVDRSSRTEARKGNS